MVPPASRDTHMSKTKKKAGSATPAKRENKTDKVLALLRRNGGASVSEITAATNWQPHSTRAVLTGFRKKGITIQKQRVDGVTRYSIELAA